MQQKEAQHPPWIRPEMQQDILWRDHDILISVPAKSGTTWTMNIVYQLLVGGKADFDSVYQEVPWIEFVGQPDQNTAELVHGFNSMPLDKPRAFKTHSAPPELPFIKKGSGKDIKYIVVCRNPEEALVSFKPFLEQHTDDWYRLWGVPREALTREDFQDFYYEVIDAGGMQGMFFGFLAAWWPYRYEPNVLFLHYSDMKRDHEGSIRKIADFLGIEPQADQWQKILHYTGFAWMKENEEKFEVAFGTPHPVLVTGAMMRKGKSGAAREDGMTDEIASHLRKVGEQICSDEEALQWFYRGGALS